MYRRCYAPKPEFDEDEVIDKENVLAIEFEEDDEASVDPAKEVFLEHHGNTCGKRCHKDSDCFKGGFVECGTCNKVQGTHGYNTCIDTSTPAPAPTPWNYFPQGGQCSKHCRVDSDCQKGGFNPCGSCGMYEGTEMYRRCYAPKPEFDEDKVIDKENILAIEFEEDDEASVDPAKEVFLEHHGNTCGKRCHKDSDCFKGGFVECGTCNKVQGTHGYNTCIDTSTPAPAPWNYFPEGGQCSKHCRKDSDCQKGGFNPCGSCGMYEGTVMYHKCYAPKPE